MFFFNTIKSTRISFDASRVRALTHDNHLLAIPAPGPGRAIQVVSAAFRLDSGDVAYSFTNNLCLRSGRPSHPQFILDVAIVNSSFDEWVGFIPVERGTLSENRAITFGPIAGANVSFTADSDVYLDIAYRVVKY